MTDPEEQWARRLAVLLTIAGMSHFVVPSFFDRIVHRVLPGSARFWTLLSGVAELACAGVVIPRRTRRLGGLAAAVLFVAVFPANVQMALDYRTHTGVERAGAYGRLPLQLPLVLWALRVSTRAAAVKA